MTSVGNIGESVQVSLLFMPLKEKSGRNPWLNNLVQVRKPRTTSCGKLTFHCAKWLKVKFLHNVQRQFVRTYPLCFSYITTYINYTVDVKFTVFKRMSLQKLDANGTSSVFFYIVCYPPGCKE